MVDILLGTGFDLDQGWRSPSETPSPVLPDHLEVLRGARPQQKKSVHFEEDEPSAPAGEQWDEPRAKAKEATSSSTMSWREALEENRRRVESYSGVQDRMRAQIDDVLLELDRSASSSVQPPESVVALSEQALSEAAVEENPLLVPTALIDYSGWMHSFERHARAMSKAFAASRYIPPLEDSYADPRFSHRGSTGDQVLQRLRDCFSIFPDAPVPFQWKLFETTCMACGPLIYGTEYTTDQVRRFVVRSFFRVHLLDSTTSWSGITGATSMAWQRP